MANFTPSKKTAQDFNNGIEYVDGNAELGVWGDAVHAESINNVIEGFLYMQGLAVNQPDATEADGVGDVGVSIITAADGSSRLKFKNLKGNQGVGIKSITSDGIDLSGGNKYRILLENGDSYSFVAPKGTIGETGNGIASTAVTYSSSTSGVTAPTSGWQSIPPSVAQGSYLWTQTYITYTNGTKIKVYSSAYQGVDGKGSVESVNGQTGEVTITPANIGALPIGGGTITGSLTVNGSVTAPSFYATSDRRAKDNIADCELDYLSVLDKISVKEFIFKCDKDRHISVGLIAQELQDILPEKYRKAFIGGEEGDVEKGEYLSINDGKMTYLLLGALKAEREKRQELENRLNDLEAVVYGVLHKD